jgi:hypothetical protein
MPGLNGIELSRRACELRPDLADRFIFMTGGIVDPKLRQELEGRRCIHKPFAMADVLREVGAVLASRE